MIIIRSVLEFVVPCWFINMALNTFKFIPGVTKIDRRLDFNKNFFDKRPVFGPSTTITGLPVALISGIIAESFLGEWKLGIVAGLTVYFGHALGSFIKRRLNIPPGKFLPLVDHGDYIFLTGILFLLLNKIDWLIFIFGFLLTLIVHPMLCYIGFKLHLRDQPL